MPLFCVSVGVWMGRWGVWRVCVAQLGVGCGGGGVICGSVGMWVGKLCTAGFLVFA